MLEEGKKNAGLSQLPPPCRFNYVAGVVFLLVVFSCRRGHWHGRGVSCEMPYIRTAAAAAKRGRPKRMTRPKRKEKLADRRVHIIRVYIIYKKKRRKKVWQYIQYILYIRKRKSRRRFISQALGQNEMTFVGWVTRVPDGHIYWCASSSIFSLSFSHVGSAGSYIICSK